MIRQMVQMFLIVFCLLLNNSQWLWANQPMPFKVGEKITYSITKVGVKTGEATLVFQGEEKLNDKPVYLIVFTARSLNFFDEEKIFVDQQTFYPLRVERDLNIWGKKEKIIEDYLVDQGLVKITKTEGKRTTEQTIDKEGMVDNIYSFIYRYRTMGNFKIGDTLDIFLPTKDIKIKLEKMMYIKVANQVFDSFYMRSQPAHYQVWFDSGEKKLPLRINGAMGLGAMSMVMTGYQG